MIPVSKVALQRLYFNKACQPFCHVCKIKGESDPKCKIKTFALKKQISIKMCCLNLFMRQIYTLGQFWHEI